MDNYIFIRYKNILTKVIINDINYIQADGDYCKIFTNIKMYHVHMTLLYIENKLSIELFYRCHRSYLVNIDKITSIEQETIYIDNTNINIPIAESSKKELLEKINLI